MLSKMCVCVCVWKLLGCDGGTFEKVLKVQ